MKNEGEKKRKKGGKKRRNKKIKEGRTQVEMKERPDRSPELPAGSAPSAASPRNDSRCFGAVSPLLQTPPLFLVVVVPPPLSHNYSLGAIRAAPN